MTLSLRQQEVLRAYRDFEREWHRPPTTSELADILRVTWATAKHFLLRLRAVGYITDQLADQRAIRLLDEADDVLASIHLTNGDRQRVQSLRGRIAELLGKPFAEAHP